MKNFITRYFFILLLGTYSSYAMDQENRGIHGKESKIAFCSVYKCYLKNEKISEDILNDIVNKVFWSKKSQKEKNEEIRTEFFKGEISRFKPILKEMVSCYDPEGTITDSFLYELENKFLKKFDQNDTYCFLYNSIINVSDAFDEDHFD